MSDFRIGTTAEIAGPRPRGILGEIIIDTDKKTVVVEDGMTNEGIPLAREDLKGINLSNRRFSYLEAKTPVWGTVTDDTTIRLHGTDINVASGDEIVLKIPGLYVDIAIPFDDLDAILDANREGNNDEVDFSDSGNCIKVLDFSNIEVFAGITTGSDLLLSARNKSRVPGTDITRQIGIYLRNIRIVDTPQLPIVDPVAMNKDVTYWNGSRWIPAGLSLTLAEWETGALGTATGSNDKGLKLRSTANIDIGSVGDGELKFQFPGGNIHTVSYSKLRTLTKVANDTLASTTGDTPNAFQVTETITNAPSNINGSVIISIGMLENTNRVMIAAQRTTTSPQSVSDNTDILEFFRYELAFEPR